MSATNYGRSWTYEESTRFTDAMEKVCGMLGVYGSDLPPELRRALLDAKRAADLAREKAASAEAAR